MKITYFFEPWIELERPELKYHNLRYQLGPQIESMLKNEHEVTIILGDSLYEKCLRDSYIFDAVKYIVIDQNDLKKIFSDYLTATCSLAKGTLSEYQKSELIKIITKKIENAPDIIISFLSPIDILKDVYKTAKLLYCEFGIFSRAPYPRTFYFDENGIFNKSYITKLPKDIKITFDEIKIEQLENFKNESIYNGLNKFDPFYNLSFRNEKFEKIVLLPLQFSGYFGFDSCCQYKSQFEYLVDILERIPKHIGILVTEHVGWTPVVTKHNIDYLSNKYPNFIYEDVLYKYRNSSQFLLDKVDGVISVSSSVALQAMLFDTPIFCEWDSHLKPLSVVESIDNIDNYFKSENKVNYSNIIHHLLCNYYLTEDIVYDSEKFLNWVHGYRESDTEIYRNLTNSIRVDLLQKFVEEDSKNSKIKLNPIDTQVLSYNNSVKNLINQSDVISFDIFDTLVERPFRQPHMLFLLIQEKVRDLVGDPTLEFHKLRRLAEHIERKESIYEEVNIFEIYNRLQYLSPTKIPDELIRKLIDIEKQTELKLCKPKETGKIFYTHAVNTGKKISIVSDFYMGSDFLEELLHKCGYTKHSYCFSSCDFRATKSSGNIYKEIKNSDIYHGKNVLHIGDNFISDVKNARKNGWKALHIEKSSNIIEKNPNYKAIWKKEWDRNVFPTNDIELSNNIYFGLIYNKLASHPKNISDISLFSSKPNNFGYIAIGPIIYSFVSNLLHLSKRDNIKKLYFLSRDGWLIKEAFDLINDGSIETIYLPSSRKSYMLASINNVHSFKKTLDTPFTPTSIRNLLLKRYNVDCSNFDLDYELRESGLNSIDMHIHPMHQIVYLKKFFHDIYPKLKSHFDKYHNAFDKYIKHYGLDSNISKAIVDIGYSGTLQEYLINHGVSNLNGYYFITHTKAYEIKEKYGVNIKSFVAEFIDHQNTNNFYCNNISIIETIFSSKEGSLVEILNSDNKIILHRDQNNCSIKRTKFIDNIHNGVFSFIKDFEEVRKSSNEFTPNLSITFCQKTLEHFINQPRRFDSQMFLDIEFEDSFSSKDKKYLICETKESSLWKEGYNSIFSIKKSINSTTNIKTNSTTPKNHKKVSFTSIWKSRFKRLLKNPKKLFSNSKYSFFRKASNRIWN